VTPAETLTLQLGGRWTGGRGRARCPCHDDHDPSLSIDNGDNGAVLVICRAGCEQAHLWLTLRERGLIDKPERATRFRQYPPTQVRRIQESVRWSSRAASIWSDTEDLTPAAVPYYGLRGCAYPSTDDVRFAPRMLHWQSRSYHPCIVARITDAVTGEPMSLHLTYLSADRTEKARLDRSAKLYLSGHAKAGGVIRLGDMADVARHLAVAEGIETALALTAALGSRARWRPVWAALDAHNLANFPVLPDVETLVIFPDRDPSGVGERAGRALAQRWHNARRRVWIAVPPGPPGSKRDWNDLGDVA